LAKGGGTGTGVGARGELKPSYFPPWLRF